MKTQIRLLLMLLCSIFLSNCHDSSDNTNAFNIKKLVTPKKIIDINDTLFIIYTNPILFTESERYVLGLKNTDKCIGKQRWGSFTIVNPTCGPDTLANVSRRDTLWGQVILSGQGGYHQVLNDQPVMLGTSNDKPLISNDIISINFFYPHLYQVDSLYSLQGQTIMFDSEILRTAHIEWDIKYCTYTTAVDSSFNIIEDESLRNESLKYDTYAYWINKDYISLTRANALPPQRVITKYIRLAYGVNLNQVLLAPAYRPTLAHLLRAYRKYPMPDSLKQHIDKAITRLDSKLPDER